MKKILSIVAILGFCSFVSAQVIVNNGVQTGVINNSNVGIDLSLAFSTEAGAGAYVGKGVIIPRVDLVNFEFDLSLVDGVTFPTIFDGMIVYNGSTGTTLTTGNRSSTATAVVPGFYYFSNPNGATNGNVFAGTWQPLGSGGSGIKSKTVTDVVADGVSATLNLGTSVITENEVVEFLGAKVYNADGDLVIEAFSDYEKATNILATGNGMMYQVLPEGTYKVLVEYK